MAFQLVGRQIAHYEVLAPLGAGAMSEVYRCRDTRLDRQVALKVIHESIASREQLVQRFEQEARAAARLEHPNVARVHYAGTEAGKAFYAMELVDGWSLAEIIQRRVSFTWAQFLALFAQACAGLQAASHAGICHGDVKPANLLVARDGTLKLLDFGLARFMDDHSPGQAGTVMGTPYYMAPELARGRRGDHRADLYSLGASFFHLLCGRPPFEAETPRELLDQHTHQAPPYLRDLGGRPPQALASLLAQLLAKAPWDRPPSGREVHSRLLQIHAEMPAARSNSELQWCSRDQINSESEAEACGLCGQNYPQRERHESFHVDVVGWTRNDGERAVASFISDALGMETVEVEPLLRPLPYRAAFRLPRERARKMHRKLHELGADVTLTGAEQTQPKAAEAKQDLPKQLPFTARWPREPAVEPHFSNRVRRPAADEARATTGQRTQLVVLLTLAFLALALFSANQHLELIDLRSENLHWQEHASLWSEPAPPSQVIDNRAVAVAQAEQNRSHTSQRSTEQASLLLILEDSVGLSPRSVTQLGEEIDKAVVELAGKVHLEKGTAVRTVPMAGDRSTLREEWRMAAYAPVVELPVAADLELTTTERNTLLRYQLSRAAIHQHGGAEVPPWLHEGLALLLAFGPPNPNQANSSELSGYSPTELNLTAPLSPGESLALRSFIDHLLTAHGWVGVRALLQAAQEGGEQDPILVRSLGENRASLTDSWSSSMSGKEQR